MYQVDAFADAVFQGNPAAVCLLRDWLPDDTLRAIAAENNLSETAFVIPDGDPMPLRWFTPRQEVSLCGHATLAAGCVVLTFFTPEREVATFTSAFGTLSVSRAEDRFAVDLPAVRVAAADRPLPGALLEGLGAEPVEVLIAHDDPNWFAILENEAVVASLRPDLVRLEELHPCGVAVSARGTSADFVSRYFCPGYGIPEDPVTGSIHCALGPWWAAQLGRTSLTARQLSARGGDLAVHMAGDRVLLEGGAACYLAGEIRLPH